MQSDGGAPAEADQAAYPAQYDPAAAQLQMELYNTVRGLLASRRAVGRVVILPHA